jgi:hypothetical protein
LADASNAGDYEPVRVEANEWQDPTLSRALTARFGDRDGPSPASTSEDRPAARGSPATEATIDGAAPFDAMVAEAETVVRAFLA